MRQISAVCFLIAAGCAAVAAQKLEIVKKIALPGSGDWTGAAVDSRSGTVLLARENEFVSVDPATGKVTREVSAHAKSGAIAVVASTDHLYLASAEDGSIPVFGIKRGNALGKIPTAGKPWEMGWEETTHRMFVTNHGSSDITVVDGDDGEVEGHVTVDGQPRSLAMDGKGRVFVTVEDKGEIAQIDAKGMSLERRWFLGACQQPSGIASDPPNHRLFAVCGNRILSVTDIETGKVLSMATTGSGSGVTAYDPERRCVLSLNKDGALSLATETSAGQFTTLSTLETHAKDAVMAHSGTKHEAYIPAEDPETGGPALLVVTY